MDSPQVLSSHENPCFEPRLLPYASIEAICRHGVHLAKALSANFPSEKGVKPITRTPGFPFASLYQQALEFAEHFERAFNPDRFPFGTPERDNFCVPIPVAKGGFEWLVSCFNTVLYTYGWQLLCDGHLSVEDVFQERFVKPRITIDTLPTFGNAIVDGLETASTALGSAVDQILASNSYPQELLAPLRQAGGSQKCSTNAAAAFGLGVGSHWSASDFLDEALPVLLAEFNTPSLHQLTQIAAARRDKKPAQLRNELVEGLAENAIPASDGARLWYARGAGFGRRMIMLPAYPRLGAVLLAIKSGIAELPPELIAQLTTLQQIEGLTSDDRSDEKSFGALFPAEAERAHAWCAQFERQASAVHLAGARTSLIWLDVAKILLARVREEIERLESPRTPVSLAENGPPSSPEAKDGENSWFHRDPPDPERFPYGPLSGKKKDLAKYQGIHVRTLESMGRDGSVWIRRKAGQAWEVYFRTKVEYEKAAKAQPAHD